MVMLVLDCAVSCIVLEPLLVRRVNDTTCCHIYAIGWSVTWCHLWSVTWCVYFLLVLAVTGSCDDISAADFTDVQVSCV